MTTAKLLSTVRSRLDADTSQYWTDSYIYDELTNAEKYIVSLLVQLIRSGNEKLYTYLTELIVYSTGTTGVGVSSIDLPSNFYEFMSLSIDGIDAILQTVENLSFKKNNEYLKSDEVIIAGITPDLYIHIEQGASVKKIVFDRKATFSNATYYLHYVKNPTGINLASEPTLSDMLHDFIVEYALISLRTRDKMINVDKQIASFITKLKLFLGIQ